MILCAPRLKPKQHSHHFPLLHHKKIEAYNPMRTLTHTLLLSLNRWPEIRLLQYNQDGVALPNRSYTHCAPRASHGPHHLAPDEAA